MKRVFAALILGLGLWLGANGTQTARAQVFNDCYINIEVAPDRYMRGKAYEIGQASRKIRVEFTKSFVKVVLPKGDRSIFLAIENTDCKAYCPKAKRIRQLKPGDERLLIHLLRAQEKQLIAQLENCGIK
ncbi:hypothetical protein [Thermonema rossianum]|uniref:hypothetical protein n=1 Tax=Thermonema rossianum TaxID=55505 RepID=UPI0012FBB603|nr:hypothetical protein [Thermonema rossianum]